MLNWIKRLFTSSIPAPKAGQMWISMHSERCIRIAEAGITDDGTLMWSEQYELRGERDEIGRLKGLQAMERSFNHLPDGSNFGVSTWRRQVRRCRLVLLGSDEYLQAYRIKHGRNINPPPWYPKPTLPVRRGDRLPSYYA